MKSMKLRIGVDLGGTKIEAVGLRADGSEIVRHRVPTPRSYEECLDGIAGLVQRIERETRHTGVVGVGIPGTIVPETGLVKNANSVWLNGQPLGRDRERHLERQVRVDKDANCFALAE